MRKKFMIIGLISMVILGIIIMNINLLEKSDSIIGKSTSGRGSNTKCGEFCNEEKSESACCEKLKVGEEGLYQKESHGNCYTGYKDTLSGPDRNRPLGKVFICEVDMNKATKKGNEDEGMRYSEEYEGEGGYPNQNGKDICESKTDKNKLSVKYKGKSPDRPLNLSIFIKKGWEVKGQEKSEDYVDIPEKFGNIKKEDISSDGGGSFEDGAHLWGGGGEGGYSGEFKGDDWFFPNGDDVSWTTDDEISEDIPDPNDPGSSTNDDWNECKELAKNTDCEDWGEK